MNEAERNVETLRRGFEAFSRGDFDESLKEIHPEIEWHVAFRLPDLPLPKDVYRGHHEVRTLWTAFASVWDELAIEMEEILYVDEERMLARARFRGRGASSGVEVDRVVFYSHRLRDGKLIYLRPFDDEASARRDLGLTVAA